MCRQIIIIMLLGESKEKEKDKKSSRNLQFMSHSKAGTLHGYNLEENRT